MKPVHIVALLLAGALGGALIMKVANHAKPTVPAAAVAQLQPPATAPPEEPAPVAQAAPVQPEPVPAVPEKKPSPMPPVRREAPQPAPIRPVEPPAAEPEPVERAAPVPVQEPASVPAPISPTVAPPPVSAEPEHATPVGPPVSVPPAPQPHQVTLNAGLLLPVRLVDSISSERNAPGDAFLATLDKELVVDGFVVAERGARVEGRVVAVDRGARARGGAALALELTRLHTSDGQKVEIQTDGYFKHAEASRTNNTAKIAGGAIVGAAIGALAGGGKGAAIGAGVGGGAGAGDVLLTRPKPAELPSETFVTFTLKSAVPLTEKLRE